VVAREEEEEEEGRRGGEGGGEGTCRLGKVRPPLCSSMVKCSFLITELLSLSLSLSLSLGGFRNHTDGGAVGAFFKCAPVT